MDVLTNVSRAPFVMDREDAEISRCLAVLGSPYPTATGPDALVELMRFVLSHRFSSPTAN